MPGAVFALHTSGDLLNFHPHLHAMLLDGHADCFGDFHPFENIDTQLLEKHFQLAVFDSLLARELITPDVVDSMLSWGHSGFNVFVGDPVKPNDENHRKFLARYLLKSPVSNQRISLIEDGLDPTVRVRSGDGRYQDLSPLEFMAMLQQHIPNTWEQTTRRFGCYSSKTRGALPLLLSPAYHRGESISKPDTPEDEPSEPSSEFARLMKLVFELDPLSCPKCGETMAIKAFITDSKEISRLCENLGIQPWRAPPGFKTRSSGISYVPVSSEA